MPRPGPLTPPRPRPSPRPWPPTSLRRLGMPFPRFMVYNAGEGGGVGVGGGGVQWWSLWWCGHGRCGGCRGVVVVVVVVVVWWLWWWWCSRGGGVLVVD